MNNLIKMGVAASLAMGSLAAHANIAIPTTSGNPGDAVLFADVFNGSTLVKTYAGDTGISVNSLQSGTVPTGTFLDANLATFLAAAAPGTTVDWLLVGAGGNTGAAPVGVTTSGSGLVGIRTQNGSSLNSWNVELVGIFNNINGLIGASATPTANSWVGNNDSIASGNGFAPFGTTNDASNLGGNTGQVATAGLGTVTLYGLSAADQNLFTTVKISPEMTATLSTSGLSFSQITAVPVPAAVWLLGSGLLGLAGVARRKSAAV